jgi:hypothetical protein
MPIEVTAYLPEHEPLVEALNQRLEAGGSDRRFYTHAKPKWIPAGQNLDVGREYIVAVDETPAIHGGYCLKRQTFSAGGEVLEAASMQGPVSEGLVDARYAMLAMRLVRDMERREPRLMAWGSSERIAGLLSRLGWTHGTAAAMTQVFRGGRVVRSLPALRGKAALRPLLDLAAVLGLASLGARMGHLFLRLKQRSAPAPALTAVEVDTFGPWADAVWASASAHYGLIAKRDAAVMNAVLPREGWPQAIRLRCDLDGRCVGWAAVRDTSFSGDAKFGDLRVGSIIDALSEPGLEAAVIAAASAYLRRRGVDMAVSVMSSDVWIAGFKAAGYLVQAGRRPVYMAPPLAELLPHGVGAAHLTPLDGDGPHGF